jgi:hypothetical protein
MNLVQEALVSLTKSALFGTKANMPDNFTDKNYDKLYAYAKQQAVLAICMDGLQGLPEKEQPAGKLKEHWLSSVSDIEKSYAEKEKVLALLLDTFSKENISFMIYKGFSICRLYPKPHHREFRDIDLYLFKDYMKGNTALRRKGFNMHTAEHHYSFCHINGIRVENHASFLRNINSSFEKTLEQAAQTVKDTQPDSPLYLPALHQAAHIAHHASQLFFSGDYNIRLRTICDWAITLQDEGKSWHYGDLKHMLHHTRENRMADLLTTICHHWYGNVSHDTCKQLRPFSNRTIRLFEKSIFAKKYQRKEEKRTWVRSIGRLYKKIRFKPLRRALSKKS